MAKKKLKQTFSEYDQINQIVNNYSGYNEARDLRASNSVEGYQLTDSFNRYLGGITETAQTNALNTGVYYDEQGNERSTDELDDSGWFDSGVNGSGKLLRKSTDIMLWDGTLASDREKQKAIENGVDPELADAMGKMSAKDLAQRASGRGENFSSVLDLLLLGGVARTELNARVISDKLVPYFHPEKKEWVLKQATEDDIKAGASTLNAYGVPSESDGVFKSFMRGLSNGLGKTLPTIYNAQEAVTDLSEASWNFAKGDGFKSFDKGETDKIAERYRKASDEAQTPQSLESQDIFSAEGFASGLGQGVASLAQFAGIGGAANSLYTGFGALTGKQGLKLLGTNVLNNLNNASMFTAGMILNGGEAYESAKQAGLNEEDAATMFLAVGAINSMVEMGLGTNKMQKWLIGDKGAQQVPKIILQETGGDLSKLASKKDNILSQVIDRVNKFTEIPILGQAVEEASEEFIQTLVGATGEFLYNQMNPDKGSEGNGLFESKNLSEVFKEAFGAAAIGAILGGAGGVISRNAVAEKEEILPFIINNQSDLVKSTLAEMFENELIDESTYLAYDNRIDQLDKVWNTNKNVFSKLSQLEDVDEMAIKSHVLSLIDSEFELKKDRQDFIKNISEINGDSELSDAVKQEKVKQVQKEISKLDNQLQEISKQITSFIPDGNGNISYFNDKNTYNEIKDHIIKTANDIIPINEEEVGYIFNYSNKSTELNELLTKVQEEGLTTENKQLINEVVGLNDKDSFIDSVINTRDKITQKKIKSQEKIKEKEKKEFNKQEEKIKENKKKIKEKAAKVKKNQVAETEIEETVEESEDDFEFNFKPAELLDGEGNIVRDNIEDNEDSEVSDKINIEESFEPKEEKDLNILKHESIEWLEGHINRLLQDRDFSETSDGKRSIDREIREAQEKIDYLKNNSKTVKLTIEEEAIITNVDQEDVYDDNQVSKQDGLVKSSQDLEGKQKEYQIIDATRKRIVGNTVISLNINYAENILGNRSRKVDEYNIFDAYTDEGRLNINNNFDSRLQDPSQFKTGTTLNLIIPTYQQIVQRGTDDLNPYTEAKFKEDSETINNIPIAFTDNTGKIIGFLPTPNNIKKRVDKDFVDTELIKNREFREKVVANPNTNITINITQKSSGTPMFQMNKQSIYNALGDGNRLATGVKIGIFKEGKLQQGINNIIQDKIKLPEGITSDMYFEEGVAYSVIPTAVEGEYFALPMDVSNIGDSSANTIIKMLELYKANESFKSDADLIEERDNLSSETDFTNFKELMSSIENITYVNNDNDNYILKITKDKLILGMTEDMQFDWKDFRKQDTKDKVRDILSRRYYAVKLANFNEGFNTYSISDNGKLEFKEYNNYFDYINETNALQSNIQSEPIEGKINERYFTAQSVIEVDNLQVEPKALTEAKNIESEKVSKESEVEVQEDKKEVSKKPKNRLGLKPKAKKNNTDLNEDLVDFYNPFMSLKEEAEFLIKKCNN